MAMGEGAHGAIVARAICQEAGRIRQEDRKVHKEEGRRQ